MKMAKLILCCLLFLSSVHAYGEELTQEKKDSIKELIHVTGGDKLGEIFANYFTQSMTEVLKKADPKINPKAFDVAREEVDAIIHEELVAKDILAAQLYPVYHKYLTLEEVKGLVQFYKSPLGQKSITAMPAMTQEGMKIGEQWGQSLGPKIEQRITARLNKEGINLRQVEASK